MTGRTMTAILAGLSLLCLFMALLTGGAFAQGMSCGPRDQVVKMLAERYHETARVAGSMTALALMEVYASEKGTWTIVITNSGGLTCILAAGQAWDELPPMPKGKRS